MPAKRSSLPVGVYEKRDSLWVVVKRNGLAHHRNAHTTSVVEALAVRDTLMREVLNGEKKNGATGNVVCERLFENYLGRLAKKSKEDSGTLANTASVIKKHLGFFASMKAERVDRAILEKYQAVKLAEGLSQVSINRQLGYLRTSFTWGRKDKLTNNQPDFSTAIVRSAEEENARTGIVKESQYTKLIECFGDDIHVLTLFTLIWNAGVRPAEAFRLEWTQVLWDDNLIEIFKKQAKIGKPRHIPLRAELLDQLIKWRDYLEEHQPGSKYIFTHPGTGKRMKKNDYRIPWQNACIKAGYGKRERIDGRSVVTTDLLFYDARRAFRTYLPKEINKEDGKSVMGHTQDTTFGRYLDSKASATRVLQAQERQAEATASAYSKIQALKELIEMRNTGDITPEEFGAMKAAL